MERVTFLLEDTAQRISCMLNPESVVVRRTAGVRRKSSLGGRLTGGGAADDPLHFTGGGRTELELDLLFDTTIAGSTIASDNVRDLTRPLWDLAENYTAADGAARLRRVRLLWGKAWNFEGAVIAAAERFEHFDATGVPRRSWLRLRLVRTGVRMAATQLVPLEASSYAAPDTGDVREDEIIVHEVVGDERGLSSDAVGDRLDLIATRYYGEPSLWRVLAAFNGISDPAHIPPPRQIRIPPLSSLRTL